MSGYLGEELREGDELELRGPIGGWFAWEPEDGGPLLLVGGGSGVVPLAAMVRHRALAGSDVRAGCSCPRATRGGRLLRARARVASQRPATGSTSCSR